MNIDPGPHRGVIYYGDDVGAAGQRMTKPQKCRHPGWRLAQGLRPSDEGKPDSIVCIRCGTPKPRTALSA